MAPPILSQKIIQSIAHDIVTGVILPGSKLDELTLANRFGVSRTPIRDALRQLAITRLVQYVPRNGFSVAPIDAAMLEDLFEASSEIEALCSGLCALRARAVDRTRLDQINREGKKAAKSDPKLYAALNEKLHTAIYSGTGNKTLESVALDIRTRLAPFRSKQFYSSERMKVSVAEHDEIVAAINSFDKARAEQAMRRHISSAAANVVQYLQGQ